jgi:hypothetical protein
MPLVDGVQCTKMIRELEEKLEKPAKTRARVPIFAVSASLAEDDRFEYVKCGYVIETLC